MATFPDINAKTFAEWAKEIERSMHQDGPSWIVEAEYSEAGTNDIGSLPVQSAVGMRAIMLCTLAFPLAEQLQAISEDVERELWSAIFGAIMIAYCG